MQVYPKGLGMGNSMRLVITSKYVRRQSLLPSRCSGPDELTFAYVSAP